ncbi:MAGUK p55 subfamily member 6 isoform X1 [Drosophila pseudoobscura]|uniref:MAGUK p55 subfamily member 6 isoform X1 n=1 Tax=Drosophila pseudoobscura pseudoobscura TaxID=46245 RepID=A0A6I8VXZ1_DROPS|nr:MAGUK p55 subfamily member 6 isoform X1 [Drosophila pseudoobscura]
MVRWSARSRRAARQDKVELLASNNRVSAGENDTSDNAAFRHSTDLSDHDEIFLKGLLLSNPNTPHKELMLNPTEPQPVPVFLPAHLNNKPICDDIIRKFSPSRRLESRELAKLLAQPHFRALLRAHDEIGYLFEQRLKAVGGSTTQLELASQRPSGKYLYTEDILKCKMPVETIKMVGLRRDPSKPLGLTVEMDEYKQLVIARILAGGVIDKQSMLHVGDVILEVNGTPVHSPDELQVEVSRAKENLTLKIGPNVDEEIKSGRYTVSGGQVKQNGIAGLETGKKLTCYMRALFAYNPSEDSLLPCRDIGLPFKSGDILQIINVKDPNWWQAKNITAESDKIGLIPSQELEERRKAFVAPEADYVHKIGICGTRISKRKRKTMYRSVANCEFDKAELLLYEEVTRMPPFRRKTLVLIGVSGVGRRTLKNRLINSDVDKFGAVIPHTSRPKRALEENGTSYWFMDREEMEEAVKQNEFLEYGEHNGNLYGTHLQSIKDVINSGRMCILDCAPNALKILHNSQELMPFVIFVAAPGMDQLKTIYADRRATGSNRNLSFDRQSSIRFSSRRARTLESLASLYEDDDLVATVEESSFVQRKYEKYFDMVIINEDFDETFRQVVETLDQMSHEDQWVPVNWIY